MDDYGHYGKGIEGYIHYTQAVNRSSGGGGSGGSSGGGGGGGGGGCITTLIALAILFGFVALIGSCFSGCI